MAEVVLFHHAQGLTSGVVAFADELRRAGHTVHTPDLLDGRLDIASPPGGPTTITVELPLRAGHR